MYHHVKKLMYTVNVDHPDPRFGNMLLEQFGERERRTSRRPTVFDSGPQL